jgi:hypothetical protein
VLLQTTAPSPASAFGLVLVLAVELFDVLVVPGLPLPLGVEVDDVDSVDVCVTTAPSCSVVVTTVVCAVVVPVFVELDDVVVVPLGPLFSAVPVFDCPHAVTAATPSAATETMRKSGDSHRRGDRDSERDSGPKGRPTRSSWGRMPKNLRAIDERSARSHAAAHARQPNRERVLISHADPVGARRSDERCFAKPARTRRLAGKAHNSRRAVTAQHSEHRALRPSRAQ